MKKQTQIFMTREDEMLWSQRLKAKLPGIIFLNDNIWRGEPDARDRIEDCSSTRVYLYHGDIDKLPRHTLPSGEIEGPMAGCVIQVLRCRNWEGTLLSGRVASGLNENDPNYEQNKKFIREVWSSLKRVGKTGVRTEGGTVNPSYLVGSDVSTKVRSGSLKIADAGTKVHFLL